MPDSKSNKEFIDFVYSFYQGMKDHRITLAYEGEITQQIMKTFTELAGGNMSKIEESEAIQKKVYHVMVECLQNISKHSVYPDEEIANENNRGIFLVSRSQQSYCVTTGNLIRNEQITELTGRINFINSLSRYELDDLHKKQLKLGQLSNKGGAGLGFIDMRRKTGRELDYQFLPLNASFSFFLFTSTIPRNL
jgi:hypothetical protein